MFDLSDIGGPKSPPKKKKSERVVLLCPLDNGCWEEIDIDTCSAEDFMETIDCFTSGGIPAELMDPKLLSTAMGRRRAIDQISTLLTFPIVVNDLKG